MRYQTVGKYFRYILFSFSHFHTQNHSLFLFAEILRQFDFECQPNGKFRDILESALTLPELLYFESKELKLSERSCWAAPPSPAGVPAPSSSSRKPLSPA